jgi:hypothetical protein
LFRRLNCYVEELPMSFQSSTSESGTKLVQRYVKNEYNRGKQTLKISCTDGIRWDRKKTQLCYCKNNKNNKNKEETPSSNGVV